MTKALRGDTIYALSTGLGKAAIAIVRVSGGGSTAILARLCPGRKFPERRCVLTPILDTAGKILDRAIVVSFCGPRSFTGEDMIEFQVTGSRAITAGLLRTLGDFPYARPAEAGEFARRAFENGKLDLVEVEGLSSVVEAETRAQLDHARRIATGELSHQCEEVRELLLRSTAGLEAALDFSDVEDAAELSVAQILPLVSQANETLSTLLENSEVSERLREGMTVVIAGSPNVGKSTLLNHLAKREVAIVSSMPGTTRDSLEIAVEIGGYPITFVDTAGIRETSDPIEALGIARSRNWSRRANLLLWLSDDDERPPLRELSETKTLPVRTKCDRVGEGAPPPPGAVCISALTGRGIDELLQRVGDFAEEYFAGAGSVSLGNERQRAAARDAQSALQQILLWPGRPEEMIAEDLRRAAHAMGRLTGRFGVEEVLGEIFSRLCVGK